RSRWLLHGRHPDRSGACLAARRSPLRSARRKNCSSRGIQISDLPEMNNFFAEVKRRNVYKVGIAYIVAGWALSQGIAQVFPVFDIPNWIIRLIVLLIILGLPIALVLSWTFELTPQGIKRTETADAMPETARKKKHVWIYVVVIGAILSIG